MRATFDISVDETAPRVESVLATQGVPDDPGKSLTRDDPGKSPPGGDTPRRARSRQLALQAISLYREHAAPRGMFDELATAEFAPLLTPAAAAADPGKSLTRDDPGKSPPGDNPLRHIYPDADALALYAVTVGEPVTEMIDRLFEADDFALASMLDTVASHGVELAAQALKEQWRTHLLTTGRLRPSTGIMEFSPGYCGWEVRAQQALFARLRPAEVGITLNASCLMAPLKSVSGVLVAGEKEIFMFDPDFDFCGGCQARTCIDRINGLIADGDRA